MAASILGFFTHTEYGVKNPTHYFSVKENHIEVICDMNKKVMLGFSVTFSSWPLFGIMFGQHFCMNFQRMCSPLLHEISHQDLPTRETSSSRSGLPERFACTKASGLAPAVSSAPGMASTLQQGYSKATGLVGGFNLFFPFLAPSICLTPCKAKFHCTSCTKPLIKSDVVHSLGHALYPRFSALPRLHPHQLKNMLVKLDHFPK